MNYTERTRLVDGLSGAFLMALLVECFYGLADASYTVFHYNYSTVTTVIRVIGGIALAAALLILVYAYRKEKGSVMAYGVELLVFAITAGLLPGTYINFPFPYNRLNIVFPLAFGVYYIMKAMYIISKSNKLNSIMLAIVDSVYIIMFAYSLIAFKKYIFIAGAVATVIYFIYSMVKKSMSSWVHAVELMFVTFSMLVIDSRNAIIFFGVLMAIYYFFKAVFTTLNKTSTSRK